LKREKTSTVRNAKLAEQGEGTEKSGEDLKKQIFQDAFDLRRHLMPRYDVWRMDMSRAMGTLEFILFFKKEPNHVCVE